MGFQGSQYPLAVFFCVRDPTINAIFSQNVGENLGNMWGLAQQGGACPNISGSPPTGVPPPSILICCGVANAENLALCEAPCNANDSTSTPSVVCSTLQAGMNGG